MLKRKGFIKKRIYVVSFNRKDKKGGVDL